MTTAIQTVGLSASPQKNEAGLIDSGQHGSRFPGHGDCTPRGVK